MQEHRDRSSFCQAFKASNDVTKSHSTERRLRSPRFNWLVCLPQSLNTKKIKKLASLPFSARGMMV